MREEENSGLLPPPMKAEASASDTTVKVQTRQMDSSKLINVKCQRLL